MISKVCSKIDENNYPGKVLGVFLLVWFIISIFQAFFTELAHDEAYYWLYSRNLAWGYFDHPPMVAILIKAGYAIFANELGVRLFFIVMGTLTLGLLYLIIKDRIESISTFIIVVSSVVIVHSHVGGFLAIPDIPVVFFSALFFLLYKNYIINYSYKYAVLLGLVASAMLYSKYHGILVLIFTMFSNLSLFKKRSFYIIPIIVIVAMLPHLHWQIVNGFPTFEYHLVSRSSHYTIVHTLNYLISQLLIAGPIIGILVFYHPILFPTKKDLFLNGLKINFYGFFIFFFLMSFKGHTEAHWTAIGYLPALYFTVLGIGKSGKGIKWIRRAYIPTIILFLFARIALIVDILPSKINVGKEFHNWDKWAKEIKEVAGDRKVVFYSSFQRPAKYAFYTGGEFAHSLNQVWYRKNQFDLWNFHDSIQGEKVILFRVDRSKDSLVTSTSETYFYKCFDNFESYYDIPVTLSQKQYEFTNCDSASIKFTITNLRKTTIDLDKKSKSSPRIVALLYNGKKFLPIQYLKYIDAEIDPKESLEEEVTLALPLEEGNYSLYLSIINNGLSPGFNSHPVSVSVVR